VTGHCSLRSARELLIGLAEIFCWELEEVPSYVSIKNWVEKAGYYFYTKFPFDVCVASPPDEVRAESLIDDKVYKYGVTVDESMMIGSQKLLLALSFSETATCHGALTYNDVHVVDMSVRPSWNGESIGAVLASLKSKLGNPPSYVVSDNASVMLKAVREQGLTNILDVGHSVALCIQHTYEKYDEFKAFTKEISSVKFREVMCQSAYLLPPKQRTIARFMNISDTVQWASNMLRAFPLFTEAERNIFAFLQDYIPLIEELELVIRCTNKIMKRLKRSGLSYKMVKKCFKEIAILLSSSNSRVRAVGVELSQFLKSERQKLPNKKTVWNCSSDIIESLFGRFKRIKSSNALNGVTGRIFFLPLLTRITSPEGRKSLNVKECLEKVLLADLKQWKSTHLLENKTVKRITLLKNQKAT
jgi:hypothetical protein